MSLPIVFQAQITTTYAVELDPTALPADYDLEADPQGYVADLLAEAADGHHPAVDLIPDGPTTIHIL